MLKRLRCRVGRNLPVSTLISRGVSSMVEQRTFNPWVLGSSPRRPTSAQPPPLPHLAVPRLRGQVAARSCS